MFFPWKRCMRFKSSWHAYQFCVQSDGKKGKTVSEQNEVAWRVNSNLAQMFVLIWEPIKIQSVSQRVLAFHILGVCSEKSKQTKMLKSWVLIAKISKITWEACVKSRLLVQCDIDENPNFKVLCRNFRIFLSLRFYVKSSLEVLKLQFLPF